MNESTEHRLLRAERSLEGLSVGDAFGERFFATPGVVERMIELRAMPRGPWAFTDDTIMAVSVCDVLREHGDIEPDRLASLFAARYMQDRGRGYGGTAHRILTRIAQGEEWATVSASVFGGSGSKGNGGAMRAGPIGAYFGDDLASAVEAARRSASVTHSHDEGQAGAIAVAVAASWATGGHPNPATLFDVVLAHTPDSVTRAGVRKAADLSLGYDVRTAVAALGNGTGIIAEDTVPFALWCAARHLDDFEEAMWTTVSGLGDRDTTCAIVASIVAVRPGIVLPATWVSAREPLAAWRATPAIPQAKDEAHDIDRLQERID